MSEFFLEKGHVKERFVEANEPLKIIGYDGVVLGYFTPAKAEKVEIVLDPPGPPISDEELDREMAAGGGRTLDEILADLEKRT
jgi:hypothetical protein